MIIFMQKIIRKLKQFVDDALGPVLGIFILLFLAACTSAPPLSQSQVSQKEAEVWLQKFCALPVPAHELTGDLVMKANTREFKGQYPASLHFEKKGSFILEVTSIIGGTLLKLSGDLQSLSIDVPSKTKFNRSGIKHYLGLEMSILNQLLYGGLPCPVGSERKKISVNGTEMVIDTDQWKWVFLRSTEETHSVPVRLSLYQKNANLTVSDDAILMNIENWDLDAAFAKKVMIHSREGDLKWTWRSRELK